MCNIRNMYLLVCTQTNSKIFKNNEEQYVVSYWHHDQLGGCRKIQNFAALPKIVHLHCIPNSEPHKFNKPSTLCPFEQCLPTIKSFFNGKQCPVPGVMRTVQHFSVDSLSCMVSLSTSYVCFKFEMYIDVIWVSLIFCSFISIHASINGPVAIPSKQIGGPGSRPGCSGIGCVGLARHQHHGGFE